MKLLANRLGVLVLVTAILSQTSLPAIAGAPSQASQKSTPTASEVWEEFRRDFPFHTQVVGYHASSRTLIISEPPPHVTVESLKDLHKESLSQVTEVKHGIGVDGWVKDLILTIPEMPDAQRSDLFDRIHRHLFHTTYKANIVELPAPRPPSRLPSLDISVTAVELKKWLVEENEKFESLNSGAASDFQDLLGGRSDGIFVNEAKDVVVWVIDKKKNIDDYSIESRQFAVDSDLIIGAVSNSSKLVIIGRKRILPVSQLPPLRTEMIFRLASTKDPNLAQSYERKYVFAGRFNEKDDWAPIYLSDDLVDTEYGSLLNITDQLLKRWSQKGTVTYSNFKYADPPSFPFGDKRLDEYLDVRSVTFNWNTAGAGYTLDTGGNKIFALNRTGALPISYLGELEDNYSEAEEKGYKFFAEVGDPNLARVVQYNALYQIFQEAKVKVSDRSSIGKVPEPNRKNLLDELLRKIDEIRKLPDEEVDFIDLLDGSSTKFATAQAKIKRFRSQQEITLAASSILDPRNINNHANQRIRSYLRSERELYSQLRALEGRIAKRRSDAVTMLADWNNKYPGYYEKNDPVYIRGLQELNRIRGVEAEVRGLVRSYNRIGAQLDALQIRTGVFLEFNDALNEIFDSAGSGLLISPDETKRLKDVYLASLSARTSKSIHTPAIVISTNDERESGFSAVGGHNLDAKVTVFRRGAVPRGRVSIIQEGGKYVIVTNPADQAKASQLVRTAAVKIRSGNVSAAKSALEGILRASPQEPPIRRRTDVLNSNRVANSEKRSPGVGWETVVRPNTQAPAPAPAPASALGDDTVLITRNADGSETITYGNKSVLANSPTSRIDYLSAINFGGGDPARIRTVGFNPNEAKALVESLKLAGVAPGRKQPMLVAVKELASSRLASDYNLASASIQAPRFDVIRKGGIDYTRVSIDIDIPHKAPGGNRVILTVRKFFRGIITNVRKQQITQRIQSLLGLKIRNRAVSEGTRFDEILNEVELEIKKEFSDAVDIQMLRLEDATVSLYPKKTVSNDTSAE